MKTVSLQERSHAESSDLEHESDRSEDAYAQGSLRHVMTIAWPIVIGMLSMTAMSVTDTLLVGWLGKAELAAVGLASICFYLINALFFGTLSGVKVVVAQATGAQDSDATLRAAWAGVVLSVPFGLIVLAASCFGPQIFAAMGAAPATQQLAASYLVVRVLGALPWYVFAAFKSYAEGTGDTRTPMKVNLLANGANILLDLVMIFGFGPIPAMGMVGAAWATVLSCVLGMVAMSAWFIHVHGFKPKTHLKDVAQVLRLGGPMGLRWALDTLGFTLFTSMLARYGEDVLAAHHIAIQIMSVSFLPGYGLSEAVCVLVGQQVGAKRLDLVSKTLRSGLTLGVMVMGVMGVVFFTVPELLIGLFQEDAQVIAVGISLLQIAALFQIFDAVAMIVAGALNGASDTRYTMLVSLVTTWGVMLPLSYTLGFSLGWGAQGVWYGLTAQVIVYAVAVLWRFVAGSWRPRVHMG